MITFFLGLSSINARFVMPDTFDLTSKFSDLGPYALLASLSAAGVWGLLFYGIFIWLTLAFFLMGDNYSIFSFYLISNLVEPRDLFEFLPALKLEVFF